MWSAAADWLAKILGAGLTLHRWAAESADVISFTGRGSVHAVAAPTPGPDRSGRWVVRHYRRGGVVARYLDDRYLAAGDSRPVRELKASVEARRRGVPTPAVVAGAVYASGLFYRADIATEFIPDAPSLADLLFRSAPSDESNANRVDTETALYLAGRVVRRLEGTRVLHPDVSAGNILVRSRGGEAEAEAYVIDLDRCNVLPEAARYPHHFMRDRLERSLKKLGEVHSVRLSDAAWQALHDGFEERS